MFKNNNGAFIRKIALNDLKINKLKFFLSGIIIMISTCLLLTTTLVSYNGSMDLVNSSPYHARYQSVNEKSKTLLQQNKNFSSVGVYKSLGSEIKSDYRMSMIYVDNTAIELLNFQLLKGGMPTNKYEIAISEKYLSELGLNKDLGDSITLKYRDNITNKEIQNDFIIVGFVENYYQDNAKQYYTVVSNDYLKHMASTPLQIKSNNFNEATPNTVDVLVRLSKENTEKSPTLIKTQLSEIGSSLNIKKHNIYLNDNYIESNLIDGEQVITVLIVGVIILFSSLFVIYSIFYISVVNSVQMYAKLKALGMTSFQLKKIIYLQGNILSIIFIPIGIISSCIITYIIQPLAWQMTTDLFIILVLSIVIFLTVRISLNKPARIISKTSAIEAMQYTEIKSRNKIKTLNYINIKNLALKNIEVNRKKNLIALISLSISGILFISIASLSNSIDFNKQMSQTFVYNENYIIGNKIDNLYERITQIQQNNPFTNTLRNEIKSIYGVQKVIESKGIKCEVIYPSIKDKDGSNVTTLIESVTPELAKSFQKYIVNGKVDYKQLDSNSLIVNKYRTKSYGVDLKIGNTITFNIFSGNDIIKKQMKIVGIIDNSNTGCMFFTSDKALDKITPYNTNLHFSILSDKKYSKEVEEKLLNIIQNNSNLILYSYDSDYKMLTRAFKYMIIAAYVFVGLISCFGILNMTNILVNSVLTRKKEFALLQAVGMTKKQLRKMLYREGLNLSIKAVFVSITLGYCGSKLLCFFIKDVVRLDFISFNFSILSILIFSFILIGMQILIIEFLIRNLEKQSITKRLRSQ
ncbi:MULTISPECIES: FtsX-like permease family protein [unclassified Clostridioides]|uniref:ABC transporter permease n=1 Tax=unclassified Clostridioides TaxID=2635829 RepID=UPI001D116FF2|nr:ABC transporter permease [Clostridioides sp. ES-S-0049-03]MCC0675006.1 ABC transporter permease [Clostridioides sp. ES-W-0018-02]MCC0702288.1 ABC transporter permease [Clostridioides sp. ES-S-0049-02]MCC0710183.1 ABC transporter permease [Clostridioides sp. ES-W-0017-02]